MKRENYRPRQIDRKVSEYLSAFGAVCIEGPRWCGKTWTSVAHCISEIFIGDPAGNFQNRRLASMDPKLVLDGGKPRLIDEWQEVPQLWDAVRYAVDMDTAKGQFILTGSATPNHKGIMHSGAGRIARLHMRPMSLYESGASSGKVSLGALCAGKFTPAMTGDVDLRNIIEHIIRGGWPANMDTPIEQAALLSKEYIEAIIMDDAFRIDGVKRDVRKMRMLLKSIARNESTTATKKKLQNDVMETDSQDIDANTVTAYLDVFERLFLLDNQPPFATKVRSSVRMKQAEKRHFADPSLACALLNATPQMLLNDLETLGFLFEALCERDLKIYAESFGGQLYHYQDYNNREIDAVVEMADGSWAAIEIKLGANQINKAARELIHLRDEIAAEKDGIPPKTLIVLCALTNAAYQRPDGVYVVPITALKD